MFIQDLAIIMLIAGLTTVICHRLKQPIVFGYIVAGIIIGPHTPPFSFISDEMTVQTLAELGVIFLMFSLGLEFNLHKLIKVGFAAGIAAIFEIVLMIWLGYGIGYLFGWTQIDSIFLGAILSISSTTIIVKALNELGMKKEVFAQLIFGILIIEDIFAIIILALLSSIAVTGSLQLSEIVFTTTKLFSFLVISMLLGILIIPKLLSYIATFKSNEMLLISILGLCFGFSLLVVKLDYSVALGAFIIGAIIAESRELKQIEELINPIRDMFSAIFFVSVGLLFDLTVLTNYFFPILVITLAVLIGKVVSSSLGVLVTGRDGKTAVKVGMGLAQIGEFSFIIAALGITLKVTSEFLYSIAVGVSIITTLTTPYLIKYSDSFTKYLYHIIPENLSNTFQLYATWMQNIEPEKNQDMLKKAIKRSIVHIIIDLFIVIAIFLSGAYIAKTNIGNLHAQVTNLYMQKTIIWAIAIIISLPFLIACYRKIKALSMILAEFSVKERFDDQLNLNIRIMIAEMIPIISIAGIMAFVSLLSASILPPIELLMIVLMIVIALIAFLLPWFIRFHSKLQISVMESLKTTKKKE
jgi:CPA2 family monovalent cation:H+ antiporter-2